MSLRVDQISKSYGDHQVLNHVSFALPPGQKLGLVGANGVGKTTLLKIIVGAVEPDAGSVTRAPRLRIGYLPQVLDAGADLTIGEMLDAARGDLLALEADLRALEQAMTDPTANLDDLLARYGRASEEFERRGGYDQERRLQLILAGLQVAQFDRTRPMATLSGGEKSRIGLAALLFQAPDLLLLDEPTNHLDFAALTWLESYLADFRGSMLVVSHDRHFLNQTVQAIVEIDEASKEAKLYSGSYDFYAAMKARARAQWETDYWAQQEEIWELRKLIKTKAHQVGHNRPARDQDKFVYNFKGEQVADTISRNIRNAEERLRRIEENPIPKPPRPLEINPDFDPRALASHIPLVASDLGKRYGDNVVLQGVTVAVDTTSRIVIVGPNGAGKSTLLRLLAGAEAPDTGSVTRAASTVLGYLDQEQATLDPAQTVFDAFRAGRVGDYEAFKAELLGYGLLTYPDLAKPVAALSAGQQRKLQLACLLTQQANLLLLDEPTNHISLDVLEEFEHALQRFAGPIIAVSHDRRFIQRFAQEIWELHDGTLTQYLGGWEEYATARQLPIPAPSAA